MIFRILRYVGLALLLPGIAALVYSLWAGPAAWATDARTFWGMPIALFVFWIGIAHAGTLISAILLALGVQIDRRTTLLAELSTVCALAVAVVFPLMHLGCPERFYMAIPLLDARGSFANLRSPLVWDFCCICIYGLLSLVYFVLHLFCDRFQSFEDLRRPMAWLLFPLVLWVHTVVSLDFAVTFVPEWRGAFFPLYFIAGAIYSGLAVVVALLSAEGCRVRLLEKLMICFSVLMFLLWVWNFALKGNWSVSVFVFGALLPQLWWVSSVRESVLGRLFVSFSVIAGLWLERLFMVIPSAGVHPSWVDFGLAAFGLGAFLLLFFCCRIWLRKLVEGGELLVGEVDEPSAVPAVERHSEPLTSREFVVLRFPLLVGVLVALVYTLWALSQGAFENIEIGAVNVAAMFYPVAALVAAAILCVRPMCSAFGRHFPLAVAVALVLCGFAMGMFYGGGSFAEPAGEVGAQMDSGLDAKPDGTGNFDGAAAPNAANFDGAAYVVAPGVAGHAAAPKSSAPASAALSAGTRLLWQSRCSSCHGSDGRFNEKFVREFYPVPQKLTLQRVDSIGEDSLVQVILKGRANMNPYGDRIDESAARALVRYMRSLAVDDPAPASSQVGDAQASDSAVEAGIVAAETADAAAPAVKAPAADSAPALRETPATTETLP